MPTSGSRHLSAIELALLSARVEHFPAAMMGGDPGDWELFLTGLSPRVRVAVLTELAILDLIQRWEHGEKPRVEDYLARFPELGPDDAVPIALIVEEYRCRLKAGEPPNPEQYR